MEYGFVKTAAVSPKIRVADPVYNGTEIIRLMKETWEKGARIIVFPELCITGYTCSDLFRQELLLKTAKEVLMEIVEASAGMDGLFFVGLPWRITESSTMWQQLIRMESFWDWFLSLIFLITVSSMRRVILLLHRKG